MLKADVHQVISKDQQRAVCSKIKNRDPGKWARIWNHKGRAANVTTLGRYVLHIKEKQRGFSWSPYVTSVSIECMCLHCFSQHRHVRCWEGGLFLNLWYFVRNRVESGWNSTHVCAFSAWSKATNLPPVHNPIHSNPVLELFLQVTCWNAISSSPDNPLKTWCNWIPSQPQKSRIDWFSLYPSDYIFCAKHM